MAANSYKIFSDGGSRGNPGIAAYGWLLFAEEGEILDYDSKFLGIATNNFAEYNGLAAAIKQLIHLQNSGELQADVVTCVLDSELIVKQLNGEYRVKNAELQKYFTQIQAARNQFPQLRFVHVPREQNRLADRLVNITLDNYELIKAKNL